MIYVCAKERALDKGYKHVWPSNGSISVKKTDTSVPLVISIEHDINQIVCRDSEPCTNSYKLLPKISCVFLM